MKKPGTKLDHKKEGEISFIIPLPLLELLHLHLSVILACVP